MENICDNRQKNAKAPRAHFAKPVRTRNARRSMVKALLPLDDNCSVTSSCTTNSTDSEWNNLQSKIALNKEIEGQFEDYGLEDETCVRELTFNSPVSMKKRLSLGTIATHREELELVKKSMELDDEIEYLNAFIDAMEENFKTMFGEVTAKRLISEFEEKNGRKPKTFNYYDVIDNIDLHVYPYVEWANKIEQAIAEKLE